MGGHWRGMPKTLKWALISLRLLTGLMHGSTSTCELIKQPQTNLAVKFWSDCYI